MVFDACSSRISQAHGEERSLLLPCLICCLHIISRHHRRRILLRRKTKYSYCDKRGATRKELIFSLNYNIANITRGRVEVKVMIRKRCRYCHFSLLSSLFSALPTAHAARQRQACIPPNLVMKSQLLKLFNLPFHLSTF